MKVARKQSTATPAQLLELVRDAGERGATAREVAAKHLTWGILAAARALGALARAGLVRSEWTPFKGGPGDPLQEARYWLAGTPAPGRPEPSRSPIGAPGTRVGAGKAVQGALEPV